MGRIKRIALILFGYLYAAAMSITPLVYIQVVRNICLKIASSTGWGVIGLFAILLISAALILGCMYFSGRLMISALTRRSWEEIKKEGLK